MMNKSLNWLGLLASMLLYSLPLHAQQGTIRIPLFEDAYTTTVKKLEAGELNIDYLAFREDFLKSRQYAEARRLAPVFDSLQTEMYKAMKASAYKKVISVTQAMLSIDYTSMIAHKVLQQTYTALKDTELAKKYHDIEFGLLNSIIQHGDGKTCASSWPIIQVSEKYFILEMLRAKPVGKGAVTAGGLCDQVMVTTDDGKQRTYYFDVSRIFER